MEPTQTHALSLTGTGLKRIACVSMLIDHIGASCLEAGLLASALYAAAAEACPISLVTLDHILRYIGRLAFPIYCFLLVEGFLHTRSVKKYAVRLLVFGLISELPFDWAFFRTPFYWKHQNVYWTLLFGVLAMALLRRCDGDGPRSLKGILCAGTCMLAAELLRTDYGAIGVALIVALYLLRDSRSGQCVAGALITAYEITAPLAFVLTWFYNGQRGRCSRFQSRLFYLFYPVHLLVLGCVTNLVIHGGLG